MKKLLLMVGVLAVLGGCDQVAKDGYRFERAEYFRDDVRVKTVAFPDRRSFELTARLKGVEDPSSLEAFSVLNKEGCTIYIEDPVKSYRPEFYGHELAHCVYGRFHPSQNGS